MRLAGFSAISTDRSDRASPSDPAQSVSVCSGGGALCRCHENLVKIAKKVKTADVLADWACASEAKIEPKVLTPATNEGLGF